MFTSIAPGVDMARLAREHDVDLLLVDAPDGLLEDARVLALLEHAPCDVGVVVGGEPRRGPVLVPFAGAEHDWAAVELGAWLARARGAALRLAGRRAASTGATPAGCSPTPRSRCSARSASPPSPSSSSPTRRRSSTPRRRPALVVVGLTDRWRREGLGRARTALATQTITPTMLVRRGVRPGGLAPRGSETRFTWTIAG